MPLVPIICFLAVTKEAVRYHNAKKAADASKKLYMDVKHECKKNIHEKKKECKEIKKLLNNLHKLESQLNEEE